VWKATYRILLGEERKPPLIQGWAVVDNTQDEDWENVQLSLIAGLPVSFVHDLYTPRSIKRPVVAVKETTGVLPPTVEESMGMDFSEDEMCELEDTALASTESAMEAARLPAGARPLMARMAVRRTAVSSAPTQVRERKLGDLFEYEIEHPVTIRRNQSALVPIVLRPFEGRPVLLYNKTTRTENPMRSVEFKNTTGLTLEGGPVTVLEGGSYVGEAMLETTKPDDLRLVPYAVELGVSVMDNIDSHEDDVSRVVIRDRGLTTYRLHVQQTTYTLHNKSEGEHIVYLDHPRVTEWQLYETPQPHEITERNWRFRFILPAKKVTTFEVRQRYLSHYNHSLADLTMNTLGYWLQQRYFDRPTEKLLRQIVEMRQQAASLDEQIKRLEKERETIHSEQNRIRENLQSLGDRPAEKELRERFVRTLNTQEDRLEQIEREWQQKNTERDGCREQINVLLSGLEYEAEVSSF
jgi:hypothetical protein